MSTETSTPAKTLAVVKPELSHSERFTQAIEKEFSTNGEVLLTNLQRKLIQNYFIKIDSNIKDAEAKRLKKPEKYRDPVPVSWANINMARLAVDVIAFSAVGMDPNQDNHINPIIYKNGASGKYDINFIPGYKGIEIKARKYGLDVPDNVVVELVFSKDEFEEFKKDMDNRFENYHFKVKSSFDRGEVVGGFYFHQFFDKPEKNKLKTFSKKDIDKRKPENASAEFWGGEKATWAYDEETNRNKKTGTVTVEGWYEEMAYKTVYRAAYSSITIDSEKIDDNYMAVIQREQESRDLKLNLEIANNANKKEIGFTDVDEEDHTDVPTAPETTSQPEAKKPAVIETTPVTKTRGTF